MDRIYDFDHHHDIVNANNHDPKTGVLNWDISSLWILGWPDRENECWAEQVALAERIGHPYNLAFTYGTFATWALNWMGQHEEARAKHKMAMALAREHDMAIIEVFVNIAAGVSLIATGDCDEGLKRMEAGITFMHSYELLVCRSYYDSQAALALGHMGRLDAARERVRRACDMADDRQQGMHFAEVWRIRGLLDEMAAQPADAEREFRRAIEIAVGQRAKSWELRAVTSLARLWRSKGNPSEARDLLAPVYDWFTEGFDTADLKDA